MIHLMASHVPNKNVNLYWRPICYHPFYTGMLLVLHLIFIIVLEILIRRYGHGTSFSGSNSAAYFAWQYLATMYAVGTGLVWEVINVSVRRMEPYHQMSKPNGASSADSLLLDYMTAFQYFIPWYSANRKHWAVLLSSSSHILAHSALPALASAMWELEYHGGPSWRAEVSIQRPFLRAVQAVNGVVMLLSIILIILFRKRQTRLQRDPSSIRAIAALISGSPLVDLFKQIPSYESHKTIQEMLKATKFELEHTNSAMGCRIVPRASPTTPLVPPTTEFKQSRLEAHPWILWGRTTFAIQVALGVPVIIIEVGLIKGNISPAVTRPLYTLCLTIASAIWQTAQRDVSLLQPYVELSRKTVPSSQAIYFDFLHLAPFPLLVAAWKRKTPMLVTVSFCSFLVQAATICYPSLFNELYTKIHTHSYDMPPVIERRLQPLSLIAKVIGVLLLGGSLGLFLSRRKPVLPRNVNTLASHILYLCNGPRLLSHIEETFGGGSDAQRRESLSSCFFGWHQTENGQWVIGIEKEQQGWHEYIYGQTSPDLG